MYGWRGNEWPGQGGGCSECGQEHFTEGNKRCRVQRVHYERNPLGDTTRDIMRYPEYCSPRRQTHFEPPSLELTGTL